MPKKSVHGRPSKSKSKQRRATPRPNGVPGADSVLQQETLPMGAPTTTAASIAPRAGARPVSSATTRRSAAASRRTPVTAINYQYLRRDIRALAVTAPAMVILLVAAFIVLH